MPRTKRNKKFRPTRKWTNAVKKVIGRQLETKSHNAEVEEVSISTATVATITTLNTVTQGNGSDERIGDVIRGFGLMLKLIYTATSAQDTFIRMLVIDADEDTFDANNDQFWLNPANNFAESLAANSLQQIYQDYNKKQVKVLWDKVIKLAGTSSVEATSVRFIKKFLKFNHKIEYNASSGESRHHNLRLIIHCVDSSGDTASTIERAMVSHYYYTDG